MHTGALSVRDGSAVFRASAGRPIKGEGKGERLLGCVGGCGAAGVRCGWVGVAVDLSLCVRVCVLLACV